MYFAPHTPAQQPGTVAATDTVELTVRYRPLADVLIGTISAAGREPGEPSVGADTVEVLDADTRLVWNTPTSGPRSGQPALASFEIVHALARWNADRLPMLHPSIASACVHEAQRHAAALQYQPDPVSRMGYRGQATFDVARSHLERSANAPKPLPRGSQGDALRVARALEDLADSLEHAVDRTPRPRFHDEHGDEFVGDLDVEIERTTELCELTRELACALADHDARPAPGTSAATRQAVRGGLPLGFTERRVLQQALIDIDEAARWPAVATVITSLARALRIRPADESTHPSVTPAAEDTA